MKALSAEIPISPLRSRSFGQTALRPGPSRTALQFSGQHVLDRRILQSQVGVHALQLRVLGLESLRRNSRLQGSRTRWLGIGRSLFAIRSRGLACCYGGGFKRKLGPINNPTTLKESIIAANGGVPYNIAIEPNTTESTSSGAVGRFSGSSLNSSDSSLR